MLTNEQKKRKLIEKCVKYIPELLESRIPSSGVFGSYPLHFDWPGTELEGLFIIEPDYVREDMKGRRIRTAVRRADSDRIISHYYYKGTNEELCRHIKDSNVDELIREFDSLARSADD